VKHSLGLSLLCSLLCAGLVPAQSLLIQNATVIDGTGAPPRQADVLISNGRIVADGPNLPAPNSTRLDARGELVAIDPPRPNDPFAEIRRHAHLDTRAGQEAALEASLPDASAEQLVAAAQHAQGEPLRMVRAELLHRGMPIPLPGRRGAR
jgi:hypothetical protein